MTPIMSIAGLGGPTPSFTKNAGGGEASFAWKYHMHGNTMGGIKLYWMTSSSSSPVDDGTLNELTFTRDGTTGQTVIGPGQQQTDETSAWKDGSADLSDYWGQTGRIAFLYYKTPEGYRGDAGLDNMAITINGVTTNLNEGTSSGTSTLWWTVTSYGDSYSSIANCVSDFEASNLSWTRCVDVAVNNDGGAFLKNDNGTGSQGTGPSQSARGGTGYYYIYAETSNNAGMDNNANRYAFLLSNEFTLS